MGNILDRSTTLIEKLTLKYCNIGGCFQVLAIHNRALNGFISRDIVKHNHNKNVVRSAVDAYVVIRQFANVACSHPFLQVDSEWSKIFHPCNSIKILMKQCASP